MSQSSSQDSDMHLWERWPSGVRVPFHQYCPILPRYQDGYITWRSEQGESLPLQIFPTAICFILQHTPLVVFVAAVGFLVTELPAILGSEYGHLLINQLTLRSLAILGLTIGWLIGLVALIRVTMNRPRDRTVQVFFVYGMLFVLTSGVILVLYATFIMRKSNPAAKPATFVVDFWLLLFLGGILVYDWMLRTENMFGRLDKKEPSIVKNEQENAYQEEFISGLRNKLSTTVDLEQSRIGSILPFNTGSMSIPVVYLFAGLFVAPFLIIWLRGWLRNTPSEAGAVIISIIKVLALTSANFVIVVVAHQFLVLMTAFNELLSEHSPSTDNPMSFHLQYKPFHPDGYAGFRDFGRFATRVNMLLLLGGLFHAVRVYIYGIPILEKAETTSALIIWGIDHIVPIIFYLILVVLWLYMSLWRVHKVMRQGREFELKALASNEDDSMEETVPKIEQAPVWPMNINLIYGLISADLIPLLSLLPFLPS